jgi:hypothetical protein
MDRLHISALRNGANGSNPQAPNYATYDESKANPYPDLSDPLALKNGRKATSARMWWEQRRPEIVEDFDREICGRVPEVIPGVKWEVTKTTGETVGDVPILTKQLVGHADNSAYPQNHRGYPGHANHSRAGGRPRAGDYGTWVNIRSTAWRRPRTKPRRSDLATADAFQRLGLRGHVHRQGAGRRWRGFNRRHHRSRQQRPAARAGRLGRLRAWAWGASRVLDCFETDKSVDAKHAGIEGIRATERRSPLPWRTIRGSPSPSSVPRARVASRFTAAIGASWWRTSRRRTNTTGCGQLPELRRSTTCPVDSHELVALCAPRPVFISAGAANGDGWIDAKGMFLAAASAGPVYKLLGKKDMGTTEFPPIETALIDGDVAFRQHTGGHTPAPNWPTFITFAERYMQGR